MISYLTDPWLLPLASGLPVLLAIGLMMTGSPGTLLRFAPWAALPALLIALTMPLGARLDMPWLLFGSQIGIDETARIFLFFSALLWLVSGIYSAGYLVGMANRRLFFIYFLLAMGGNLGLVLAQELMFFYTCFALMSFAAYGLVVHQKTASALYAGRVYIVLVVIGEVLLFAAFVMAARAAGGSGFAELPRLIAESVQRDWIIGLTLLGFGIKAGMIGLHIWLPLAHPVAPTPASAVLSGSMIAAGLLGWLRVLPLGQVAMPLWGGTMIVAGLVAAFYAVIIGLLQSDPKKVLAYSSVSKMGIMTSGVGLGLTAPTSWPLLLTAILFYALHHGLAKGALFLGTGLAKIKYISKGQRVLLIAGLLLSALSLSSAPLTSGMIAKHLLLTQAVSTASDWSKWLQILLPCGSVATSFLMARFLYLVWPPQVKLAAASSFGAMWWSWSALLVVVLVSPGFAPLIEVKVFLSLHNMVSATWPILLAAALAAILWLTTRERSIPWQLPFSWKACWPILKWRPWPLLVPDALLIVAKIRSANCKVWRDRANPLAVLDAVENHFGQWTLAISMLLLIMITTIFLVIV